MYTASEIELDKMLATVLERNASDLHLAPGEPPIIRVDGALIKLDSFSMLTPEAIAGISDVLIKENQRSTLKTQEDLDLSFSYKKRCALSY